MHAQKLSKPLTLKMKQSKNVDLLKERLLKMAEASNASANTNDSEKENNT